jgi:hypothetical protein
MGILQCRATGFHRGRLVYVRRIHVQRSLSLHKRQCEEGGCVSASAPSDWPYESLCSRATPAGCMISASNRWDHFRMADQHENTSRQCLSRMNVLVLNNGRYGDTYLILCDRGSAALWNLRFLVQNLGLRNFRSQSPQLGCLQGRRDRLASGRTRLLDHIRNNPRTFAPSPRGLTLERQGSPLQKGRTARIQALSHI